MGRKRANAKESKEDEGNFGHTVIEVAHRGLILKGLILRGLILSWERSESFIVVTGGPTGAFAIHQNKLAQTTLRPKRGFHLPSHNASKI